MIKNQDGGQLVFVSNVPVVLGESRELTQFLYRAQVLRFRGYSLGPLLPRPRLVTVAEAVVRAPVIRKHALELVQLGPQLEDLLLPQAELRLQLADFLILRGEYRLQFGDAPHREDHGLGRAFLRPSAQVPGVVFRQTVRREAQRIETHAHIKTHLSHI